MRIVSLVMRVKPEDIPAAREELLQIPGVEIHAEDMAEGRMIVTVEDFDESNSLDPVHANQQPYSTADSIIAAHKVPQIMSVTLAYEYTDEFLDTSAEASIDNPDEPAVNSADNKHASQTSQQSSSSPTTGVQTCH